MLLIIERFNLEFHHPGIYRNGDGEVQYDESGRPSSNGSLSSGFAHYGDYLYADTMLWAINGWLII